MMILFVVNLVKYFNFEFFCIYFGNLKLICKVLIMGKKFILLF
jgi:hypothetical protein